MWARRRRIILWWRSVRVLPGCRVHVRFRGEKDEQNAAESAVCDHGSFGAGGRGYGAIELRFAVAEQQSGGKDSDGEWCSLRRAAERPGGAAGLHAFSGCRPQEIR